MMVPLPYKLLGDTCYFGEELAGEILVACCFRHVVECGGARVGPRGHPGGGQEPRCRRRGGGGARRGISVKRRIHGVCSA
jgi:hypothetical protein